MQKALMIRHSQGTDDGISKLNEFLAEGWKVTHVYVMSNDNVCPACFVIIEKDYY